jgi:hypothetical protein
MRKNLLQTLQRDIVLLGLIASVKKPMTIWKFLKYVYPEEMNNMEMHKKESYIRKFLIRWSEYGILKKEVVDGKVYFSVDYDKIDIEDKKSYWLMKLFLPDFQINFKLKKPNF